MIRPDHKTKHLVLVVMMSQWCLHRHVMSQHNNDNNNTTADTKSCHYFVSISPFTHLLHPTLPQFLPSSFPCQTCCGLSCMGRHSCCCLNSTSWSSFLKIHLAQGTVLFILFAMFGTVKVHNIGWSLTKKSWVFESLQSPSRSPISW